MIDLNPIDPAFAAFGAAVRAPAQAAHVTLPPQPPSPIAELVLHAGMSEEAAKRIVAAPRVTIMGAWFVDELGDLFGGPVDDNGTPLWSEAKAVTLDEWMESEHEAQLYAAKVALGKLAEATEEALVEREEPATDASSEQELRDIHKPTSGRLLRPPLGPACVGYMCITTEGYEVNILRYGKAPTLPTIIASPDVTSGFVVGNIVTPDGVHACEWRATDGKLWTGSSRFGDLGEGKPNIPPEHWEAGGFQAPARALQPVKTMHDPLGQHTFRATGAILNALHIVKAFHPETAQVTFSHDGPMYEMPDGDPISGWDVSDDCNPALDSANKAFTAMRIYCEHGVTFVL